MIAPAPIFLATAVEAALEAGRIQRRYFRNQPAIRKKGRIDLVTAADEEVERMFRALIAARFPDHAVVGEETPGATQPTGFTHRWIIDPVDGTTNFAHGLALFSVSIALEIDGIVMVGVVYDPIADELFTAERGQGARLNGNRLAVSGAPTLEDALLVTGFPYSIRDERRRQVDVFATFLEQAQAVRRLGSAALDLCYVAAARFDGYWEERLFAWDVAAGSLIVEEAGGRVTGLDGEPLNIFDGHLIASNGHVHRAMVDVVRSARTRNGH